MKKSPLQIIVAALSVTWIVIMWVKKDLASVYGSMPPGDLLPLILTTAAVSLAKIAALTALILLIKWLIGTFGKK